MFVATFAGCYAADTRPPDAWAPDAAETPDAFAAPDAFIPAWEDVLGEDCSRVTGNAYGYRGEPGEFISSGRTGWGTERISATATYAGTGQVLITVSAGAFRYEFLGPGPTLPTGTYFHVGSAAIPRGRMGLSISSSSGGCNSTSTFTVHEIAVSDDEVRAFRTSFEVRCEGSPAAFRGCISYTAP